MKHLFALVLYVLISASSGDVYAANESVDKVFETYNTFKNTPHLNEEYEYVSTLEYSDKKAFVIKYPEPEGENKRYYRYLFLSSEGTFLYEISLGSYDATTVISREMGDIGPNDRLYHLDVYCPSEPDGKGISRWGSHKTLGMFTQVPEFEGITQTISEKEEGVTRCKD